MSTLWDGVVADAEILSNWKVMVHEYAGTVAVGCTGALVIFSKFGVTAHRIRLHDPTWNVACVAWTLNPEAPTDPMIVFTATSVVFILDVKTRNIVGKLRGHGGLITCLAVHPHHPYIFCTTSRDFTTRVYDLTLTPIQTPNNPHWLPNTTPSLAGPAHGLHSSEPEGEGIGRCVAVLVGGRSGGHKGAVFCAAFHPSSPLIATCGMDRAVKIWRMPPYKPDVLSREDKPLFSTHLIHKARVLSIAWLSGDILVSHSAPAIMRGATRDDMYEENGTVVIWQWLGFDRYLPPGKPIQKVMRGCASDYRNSESFKVLSAYHLPMTTRNLTVYTSLDHDPLLLVPMGKTIRIFNLSQFRPRAPIPFPISDDVVALTENLRLDDTERAGGFGNVEGLGASAGVDADADVGEDGLQATGYGEKEQSSGEDDGDGNAVDDDDDAPPEQGDVYDVPFPDFLPRMPPPAPLAELFDSVDGWDLDVTVDETRRSELPDITACEVALGGRVVVGVGGKGTMYVWRAR